MDRKPAPGTLAAVRVAVITDIHANLPALEAVLGAIDAAGVDEIWCLGDVVGYGAEPDECADLVRERCSLCLVGNHDLAVLGGARRRRLLRDRRGGGRLDAGERRRAHPGVPRASWSRPDGAQGIGLFHASPRDPIWEYVLSVEQADACLDVQTERICLIGHSHVSLFFIRAAGRTGRASRGAQASDGALLELGEGRWLINPGSVGQPRDGDPRAAWLEIDTEAETARFHRVDYDIDRAAASIVAAGLPRRLAERLYIGQ